MVTKAQIDRIVIRIDALAPKPDRVVCLWCDQDETTKEALKRHYRTSPDDRLAGQIYIFSWLKA